MKRNLLIALAAFAPLSAFAVPVVYDDGDLIMGFRVKVANPDDIPGQGAGTCYMVSLGSVATLRDATGPVTVADLSADLNSIFGAGWHDRADIQWGAACTSSNTAALNGDPQFTDYLSQGESTPGTPGSGFDLGSVSVRRTLSTKMAGMGAFFDTTETFGAANPRGSKQPESSNNGWRNYMDGGTLSSATADLNVGEIEATPATSLALFRYASATPEYQGHFTISSAGILTFTPETTTPPSGYASWAQTNVGGQAAGEDFDHDGVPNILEYFMGTDPTKSTANPSVAGGKVTWPKSATATVASATVEISTDLVNWTSANGTSAVNVASDGITYTFTINQARTFVRLHVEP